MRNPAKHNNAQPDNLYQCHHIFPDNHRCGSPRMRNEQFCYYHHDSRRPVVAPYERIARRSTFSVFTPTSFRSIHESLGEVMSRIAANDIDPRRAGLLLYALQLATSNLHNAHQAGQSTAPEFPEYYEEVSPNQQPIAHA